MTAPGCTACGHFVDDPFELERALPGLSSLSSGLASVRGDTGLCTAHEMLTVPIPACGRFTAGPPAADRPGHRTLSGRRRRARRGTPG